MRSGAGNHHQEQLARLEFAKYTVFIQPLFHICTMILYIQNPGPLTEPFGSIDDAAGLAVGVIDRVTFADLLERTGASPEYVI